jgi:hypothetical protein
MRAKTTGSGGPRSVPTPPWLAGAAIGLAILSMAGSAVAIGAGLAVSQPPWRKQ